MKLFDKIKDLFMDEVVDDDEVEIDDEPEKEVRKAPVEMPKREESVLPKVMRETIEKEEPQEEVVSRVKSRVKPEDFIKELTEAMPVEKKEEPKKVEAPPKKFAFQEDFNFDDYIPSKKEPTPAPVEKKENVNVNVLSKEADIPKKVSELYTKKEEVKEKPKFKATPVISPVYGVLDKNYTKEEVKERDEDNSMMKRPSKKVDFETVRKKAFGNLIDDIKENMICENCELYKEVKKISSLKEDDLLYNMTVDDEPEEVTISKAYDNYREFGVAYEPTSVKRKVKIETEEKIEIEETPEEPVEAPKLDEIINNRQATVETGIDDEEEKATSEIPDTMYSDKIDDDVEVPEIKEEREGIPTRSEKREKEDDSKVDADFFDLIDSMYKERTDD